MRSKYSDSEAKKYILNYAKRGVSKDLALRIYTTQLLGNDPTVVLHGGGNTSVKSSIKTLLGDKEEIIYVKGSGKDMGNIEEDGFPALEMKNLLNMRSLKELDDFQMVNYQRKYMLDTSFPNASVETLLHAFLPYKFVDHSHSNAILSLIDQPDPVKICKKVFGEEMGIVPYIMPGFQLAKKAAEVFDQNPNVKGLILLNHGIFTFAEHAKESYELMIRYISLAEKELKQKSKSIHVKKYQEKKITASSIANLIRQQISIKPNKKIDHKIVYFYKPNFLDELFSHPRLKQFTTQGPVTPDHVIRIKSKPLVIDLSNDKLNNLESKITKAVKKYQDDYQKYFKRNHKYNLKANMLDPYPRLILVKGIGIFSTGPSFKDAKIAMDVGINSLSVILEATKFGEFRSIQEKEIFKMEYWPLELAKLKPSTHKLKGHVTVITGGLGAIGYSTAKKFLREGSEVVLLDIIDPKNISLNVSGMTYIQCDITNENKVEKVFQQISQKFGGVDILISNAGFAIQSSLADLTKKQLDSSFDLNFFAHHYFTKHGTKIMKIQNMKGSVVFNISKQSVNPGPNFGAYGLPKATLMFLMKQYVVESSKYGIRFNGVNADRIRSGLLNPVMIAKRANSRGLTIEQYMSGNLLKEEVKASDVAEAFYHLSISYRTTASVITVDGGNIESSLR
jgi:rhamnose utilization protein RhaD (predicted bifunctional aldolase and dehydrogenase)/NAD(P)-dependent dehydrogenase (short-subunit alcohol dehydrogenase family)